MEKHYIPGAFYVLEQDLLVDLLLTRLDGRGLTRLQSTGKAFSVFLHDDHALWDTLTAKLTAARSQGGRGGGSALAKSRYLAALRGVCSSCGDDDIEMQLSAMRLYFCTGCAAQQANRIYALRAHDESIRDFVRKVEVGRRRRILAGVFDAAGGIFAVFAKAKMAPAELLYSSLYHGRSLSTLFSRCEGYSNVVTVVETDAGQTIGAFTPCAWRASSPRKEFGSPHNFLFSIQAFNLRVYPASSGHGLQLSSRSEGLALGKVEQSSALSIMADLDRGTSSPSLEFCNPGLCSSTDFGIRKIELWRMKTQADADREAAIRDGAGPESDVNTALDDDLKQMRGKNKSSVLKRGVERFMLSFVGNSGVAAAMHARNHS